MERVRVKVPFGMYYLDFKHFGFDTKRKKMEKEKKDSN